MKDLMLLATAIGQLGSQADVIGRSTGASRVPAVLAVFPILLPIAKVDFKAARDQLKNATEEERKEVNAALGGAFDIQNDKLEVAIEQGITFVQSAYGLIGSGIELVALVKAIKEQNQEADVITEDAGQPQA